MRASVYVYFILIVDTLKQWDGQVFFTEICGKYPDNNFQKKINIIKFNRDMSR